MAHGHWIFNALNQIHKKCLSKPKNCQSKLTQVLDTIDQLHSSFGSFVSFSDSYYVSVEKSVYACNNAYSLLIRLVVEFCCCFCFLFLFIYFYDGNVHRNTC